MNFLKKWFKKKKQYNCLFCHDLGIIKQAHVVAYITEYPNGEKRVDLMMPLDEHWDYASCPADCDRAIRISNEH